MICGSISGWLMLAGMMARPRAISLRTNSGVTWAGISRAEAFAVGEEGGGFGVGGGAAEVFAVGDVDHLLGDDAGARELVLGDGLAGAALEEGLRGRAGGDEAVGRDEAVILGLDVAGGDGGEAAAGEPGGADGGEAGGEVDAGVGFGVGAGGVVEAERGLFGGGFEVDLFEGDRDVGAAFGAAVDFTGAGDGAGGDGAWLLLVGHGRPLRLPGHGGSGRSWSRPYAGMTRIRFLQGHRVASVEAGGLSAP